MKIGVHLKENMVMISFECDLQVDARELAESIVEQLKEGGIDLKLVAPVGHPRNPKEVN